MTDWKQVTPMVALAALVLLLGPGAHTAPGSSPVAVMIFSRIDPSMTDDAGQRVDSASDIVLVNGRPALSDWAPLYPGDRVAVVGRGVAVRVRYDSGRTVYLEPTGIREMLVEQPKPASELGNLASWIATWQRSTTRIAASASTRGGAAPEDETRCTAPDWLVHGDAVVIASSAPMFLAWRGGMSPYIVRLTDKDGVEIKTAVAVSAAPQGTLVDLGSLKPGPADLTITDATGASCLDDRRLRVKVVPASMIPVIPPEIVRAKLSPSLAAVLYAQYLAAEYGPEWQIESLRQLAPFRSEEQAVRTWIDSVAWN